MFWADPGGEHDPARRRRTLAGPAPAPRRCCPTTSPTRAVGLAGQPLHLDQGVAAGALLAPLLLVLAGRRLGRPAGAGRRPRWRWPSSPHGPAALGPAPSGALLPDLHPAAVAELARARRVHPRRLRRGGGAVPARRRWPARTLVQQVAAGFAAAARAATAVYTAYLFAQAKGARPLADPAAVAGTCWSRRSSPGRPRWPSPPWLEPRPR